jgi:hypothetical protein
VVGLIEDDAPRCCVTFLSSVARGTMQLCRISVYDWAEGADSDVRVPSKAVGLAGSKPTSMHSESRAQLGLMFSRKAELAHTGSALDRVDSSVMYSERTLM